MISTSSLGSRHRTINGSAVDPAVEDTSIVFDHRDLTVLPFGALEPSTMSIHKSRE